MPEFDDLFDRTVFTAMARQLALADLIGERNWAVDLTAGTVTFGSDLTFAIQLLGTESGTSWLWAWANEASNLPPALLQLCGRLRDYGRDAGVPELTDASLPLDRGVDGHMLALLASGLTGRPYYRGPYDGGALFFHLEGVPEQPLTPERAVTVISQTISAFPLDQRTAVVSFFEQQQWPVDQTAESVTAHHPAGADLHLTFDSLNRITRLNGTLPTRAGETS